MSSFRRRFATSCLASLSLFEATQAFTQISPTLAYARPSAGRVQGFPRIAFPSRCLGPSTMVNGLCQSNQRPRRISIIRSSNTDPDTESGDSQGIDTSPTAPAKQTIADKRAKRKFALFAIGLLKKAILAAPVLLYVVLMFSLDLVFAAVGQYATMFCFLTTAYLWALNKFRYGGPQAVPPEKAMFPAAWVRPYSYGMAVLSLLAPVSRAAVQVAFR
jgi:hypothetical protein